MLKRHLFLLALLLLCLKGLAQEVNYDESKVPAYTLPNPLQFSDGRLVENAQDWALRRQEILGIFQREMYGQIPEKCPIWTELLEEGTTLAGFGTRKQIRMWFKEDKTGPYVDWMLIEPRFAPEPHPTILLLNYDGNHTLVEDERVMITENWANVVGHGEEPVERGFYAGQTKRSVYPIGTMLTRGYAFLTACYGDISPDPTGEEAQDKTAYTRIFDLWPPRDNSRTDNTTALGAWAWTLMRAMDMIEQTPELDETRVLLTGYSRLAKAALLAGAFDDRFPVVVPNQTGGGGAPLAKRFYGENVSTMTKAFTHWYCKAYKKYAGKEESMPFDQHMLLACVAPRALLVEGFDEGWFDTKGEFLSVQAASPVWELLGKEGLPKVEWPADYETTAIGSTLGYVRRSEEHGLSAYDWTWMMDFADRVFESQKGPKDYSLRDLSNRCSLTDTKLLASFDHDDGGFSLVGTEGTLSNLTKVEGWSNELHEGEGCLNVQLKPSVGRIWKKLRKNFDEPLDLSQTPILEMGVDASAGPGRDFVVRLLVSNNKENFECRAHIIPTLWRTVIFDLHECHFLSDVRSMEIAIMNDSEQVWEDASFQLDGLKVGKPLDLDFLVKDSEKQFEVSTGSIERKKGSLVWNFEKEGTLSCTKMKNSRSSIYNPPLERRNTFAIVLSNQSDAKQMQLRFATYNDPQFSESKSKIFEVEPHSGAHAYYINVSDIPEAKGQLAAIQLKPLGTSKGTIEIDRISFEQELPIRDYAGAITRCTADRKHVWIEGRIDDKFLQSGSKLEIYDYPMRWGSTLELDKLTLLCQMDAKSQFSTKKIENKRLEGKMTHLSTRFLAILRTASGESIRLCEPFYIENWRDFEDNPYAFDIPDERFPVEQYGAKGDGFSDDTKAIQAAIDAATEAGGGKVILSGSNDQYGHRYVATHIQLKKNVELRIEKGAILLQSSRFEDYTYRPDYGHDNIIPNTPWTHCLYTNLPLILAKETERVKITGGGVIRMADTYSLNPDWTHYARECCDRIHIVPIGMYRVDQVEISDIDILRSNNYHTQFNYLTHAFIGNVKMHEVACVSGDGLGCGIGTHDVKIVRAFFESNDDGVTLTCSYGDPRGGVWNSLGVNDDHSTHHIEVCHSYFNSGGDCYLNPGGGKAIAFIPWGSTNPCQEWQETHDIYVHDCVLQGGYSVGTWCDNPFDGKPFTNSEENDYSPVKNVRIFNNEYLSPCDLLSVHGTNIQTDCGIHSCDTIRNSHFQDGKCYWTLEGDAIVENHKGYPKEGVLSECIWLQPGTYEIDAELNNGTLFVESVPEGKTILKEKTENEKQSVCQFKIGKEQHYKLGVRGKDAVLSSMTIKKIK